MTRSSLRFVWIVGIVSILGLLPATEAAAADHRLGIGAHFWKTVDDLGGDFGDGIEDDGLSWVLSYQYIPKGLFRFELDLEYAGDGFGGAADSTLSPVGYVLFGGGLYGGLGIGVTVDDGTSDPFYAARVGYQFNLLAGIRLDLNANYRANAFSGLGDFDTDAITVGAIVRFNL